MRLKNRQVGSSTSREKSRETCGQAEPEAWRTESFSPKGVPHEQGEGMKEGKNSSNYTANIFLNYGNINDI